MLTVLLAFTLSADPVRVIPPETRAEIVEFLKQEYTATAKNLEADTVKLKVKLDRFQNNSSVNKPLPVPRTPAEKLRREIEGDGSQTDDLNQPIVFASESQKKTMIAEVKTAIAANDAKVKKLATDMSTITNDKSRKIETIEAGKWGGIRAEGVLKSQGVESVLEVVESGGGITHYRIDSKITGTLGKSATLSTFAYVSSVESAKGVRTITLTTIKATPLELGVKY